MVWGRPTGRGSVRNASSRDPRPVSRRRGARFLASGAGAERAASAAALISGPLPRGGAASSSSRANALLRRRQGRREGVATGNPPAAPPRCDTGSRRRRGNASTDGSRGACTRAGPRRARPPGHRLPHHGQPGQRSHRPPRARACRGTSARASRCCRPRLTSTGTEIAYPLSSHEVDDWAASGHEPCSGLSQNSPSEVVPSPAEQYRRPRPAGCPGGDPLPPSPPPAGLGTGGRGLVTTLRRRTPQWRASAGRPSWDRRGRPSRHQHLVAVIPDLQHQRAVA